MCVCVCVRGVCQAVCVPFCLSRVRKSVSVCVRDRQRERERMIMNERDLECDREIRKHGETNGTSDKREWV